MPVQSRLPPSAIAHLRLCGKCETGRLTPPVLCKGTKKLSDRDRWYELCLNKVMDAPVECDYFDWRDDIPRGAPARGSPELRCPGYLCANIPNPRPINVACLLGVCQQCCAHAHLSLLDLPRCHITAHDNATADRAPLEGRVHWRDAPGEPPSIDSADSPTPPADTRHTTRASSARQPDTRNGSPVTQASSATRGRRAASQPSRSARAAARTNAPAPTSTPTPPTLSQPPRVAPDRSEPASSSEPSGGHVSRHQADDLDRARSQQMTAHAAVQQAQTRTFYLKWWHKNDEPAKYIQVTAPNWPLFHPKESEHLVNRFKVDTEFFEVFDWVSDTWLSCWKDSPAQRVDVRPPQIMHYRSEGVTHAPDMPGAEPRGVKRAHDQIDYGAVPEWLSLPRTPANRRTASSAFGSASRSTSGASSSPGFSPSSMHSFPSLLSGSSSRSSSPFTTPTTTRQWSGPPSSSRFATPALSNDDWSTPSGSGRSHAVSSARSSPGPSAGPSATAELSPMWASRVELAADEESSGPLGSGAFDPLLNTPTSTIRTFSDAGTEEAGPSLPAVVSSPSPSLPCTPRGPRSSGWPLRYAVDMIRGFQRMHDMMATGSSQKDAFAAAFPGHELKTSTYSDNHKAYSNALRVPGVVEHWVALGRTQAGEWTLFRKDWKPRR